MIRELICPKCECDLYLAKWIDEPIGLAEEVNFTVQCCDCGKKFVVYYSLKHLREKGREVER